jgi:hypothetical protein
MRKGAGEKQTSIFVGTKQLIFQVQHTAYHDCKKLTIPSIDVTEDTSQSPIG